MSANADFLKTVDVFRDLSMPELETLAGKFESRRYEPGQNIIHEGEVSQNFYLIKSGFVTVTRGKAGEEIFITNLAAGEYVGEAALFKDIKRTANVQAYDEVEVLLIGKSAFEAYLQSNPTTSNRILYSMLKQLFFRLEQTSSELQFERKNQMAQSAIDKLLS